MSNQDSRVQAIPIHRATIRKSSFIGIYVSLFDDKTIVPPIAPNGFLRSLDRYLGVNTAITTVGGVSSVGSMVAMNARGVILPKTVEEEELSVISRINSETLVVDSKLLAWGNLLVVNNKGCLISNIVPKDVANQISDFLDIECVPFSLGDFRTIGSFFAVSDKLGLVSPLIDSKSLELARSVLKVRFSSTTVNDGERLVKLGVLLNDKGLIVGRNTTGSELMAIQSLFS